MQIPFNKPCIAGNELKYIEEAALSTKLSGDGNFTKKCHRFFEEKYGFQKVLLTHSCTAALEMAAILINIKPDDEVIVPSYTFVSTANAFVLRGAKIIFADSEETNPNIDATQIEKYITEKTKAIVCVHYAGVSCDMDMIMNIASKYNLYVIEDAAQAIDSFYKGQRLGSIGHFGTYSFHETKNISCGEGGLLIINDSIFNNRAEIIREKGTDRSSFFRAEIDKYGWVDIGSSYLPSELNAAFLFGQLESIEKIQDKRKALWKAYYSNLEPLSKAGDLKLPQIPEYATNNGHMFYLICNSFEDRTMLIAYLKKYRIHAVFHYLPLHKSEYYRGKDSRVLINSEKFAENLVRLPIFYDLNMQQVKYICKYVREYYLAKNIVEKA